MREGEAFNKKLKRGYLKFPNIFQNSHVWQTHHSTAQQSYEILLLSGLFSKKTKRDRDKDGETERLSK